MADKGFEDTERGARGSSWSGPLWFERNEEEDPFGSDHVLASAKSASNKRWNEESVEKRRGKERYIGHIVTTQIMFNIICI